MDGSSRPAAVRFRGRWTGRPLPTPGPRLCPRGMSGWAVAGSEQTGLQRGEPGWLGSGPLNRRLTGK